MPTAEVYVGKQVTVEEWNAGETVQYTTYIAQEVSVEPSQAIEGVDGLGNDEIQAWAPGLKTYAGTIREVFVTKDQLDRVAPFQTTLTQYVIKIIWDTAVAGEEITMKFTGVIFPSASIASPKNAPVFIDRPFRAKSVSVSVA